MKKLTGTAALLLSVTMTSCASSPSNRIPIPRAEKIVLSRYMGPWYVIAAIPLPIEKNAFDPVETYRLNPDGTIATTFQFRKGDFDGEVETKLTSAEVQSRSGLAEWRVKTVWPFKEQYVISFLETDYSSAIVGRDARDHVWILSRTPKLPAAKLSAYYRRIEEQGYDVSKLIDFPQDGKAP